MHKENNINSLHSGALTSAVKEPNTLNVPHQLLLLRHGETEWNKEQRIQGQLNSALTRKGRDQALQQGQILRRVSAEMVGFQVLCSPLDRAQDTAHLVLGHQDFATDKRLMEIGCGTWEGTRHQDRLLSDPDLVEQLQQDFDIYINAPSGEGLAALSNRLTGFLENLNRPTIIISHKIALVVMRALLCGSELSSNMAPPQGSILEINNGTARKRV